MDLFFAQTVYAQSAASGELAANPYFQVIPFVLIFVIFYFLIIRPQQKRQREHELLLSQLKKGDHVITASGIFGTIDKVADDFLMLEIADKVRVKIERAQVTRLTKK